MCNGPGLLTGAADIFERALSAVHRHFNGDGCSATVRTSQSEFIFGVRMHGSLLVAIGTSQQDEGSVLLGLFSALGLCLVVRSLFGTCLGVSLSSQKPFPVEDEVLQLTLDFRSSLARVF